MSYHASYFEGTRPFWAELPPRIGRLAYGQKAWLTFSFHPLMTDSTRMAINTWTLEVADDGKSNKEKTKMRAGLAAIMPLVLEYRAAAFAFDNLYKSQADARASAYDGYRLTWLSRRVTDAFEAVVKVPESRMHAFARNFKPSCIATYAEQVRTHGYALKLIDECDLTAEICRNAILSEPGALYLVPGRLRTRALCLEAMQTRAPGAHALRFVPPGFKDKEMCDAAIKTDGLNLEHVPDDLKTAERCAMACIQNGLAWSYVPYAARTLEVRFCYAFHGFSEESTDDVYKEAVALDPERADAMVKKYEPLLVKTHYPLATADDLADLGWPPEPAPT
jgi:hypothetical protein